MDFSSLNLDPSKTLLDIDLDYFSTSNPQRLSMKELGLDEAKIARIGKVFSSNSYDFDKVKLPRNIMRSIKPSRSQHDHEQKNDKNWQIYYHTCFKYLISDKYINARDEYWLHKMRFCRKSFTGLSKQEVEDMFLETKEFMFHQLLNLNIKHRGEKKQKESIF